MAATQHPRIDTKDAWTIAHASSATGIPGTTLRRWIRPGPLCGARAARAVGGVAITPRENLRRSMQEYLARRYGGRWSVGLRGDVRPDGSGVGGLSGDDDDRQEETSEPGESRRD